MTVDQHLVEIQQRAAMIAPMPMRFVDLSRQAAPAQPATNDLVDSTLEDSFPASDPPSWTSSVAKPANRDDATSMTRRGRWHLLRRVAATF